MFGLGWGEMIIILLILLLLFGSRKLPELAKSLGESAKELKKGFNEGTKEDKKDKSS